MLRTMVELKWSTLFVGLLALGGLSLTGCGDSEQCVGVSCDFGVCDSQTGQCMNPADCRFDGDCMPGFECSGDHVCEALSECGSDADCAVGSCNAGACVNPSSCESNQDCLARSYCADGICAPDPCNDVNCQKGQCERGTGECVSAASCTQETEVVDCAAGERCAEGTCKPPATFCDDIECDRGVCSYEAGGCANAPDCEGDNANCEEGYYCNDQNRCQVNLCEQFDIGCDDNGVCLASTGTCQNADPCTDTSECRSGHVCLEGNCRLAEAACGDAEGDGGCPGNQICDVSDDAATCVEPETCETSFDCSGDRQCGGDRCLAPVSCTADRFEPNNAAAEATAFLEHAYRNTLDARLCENDVDTYTFDSNDLITQTANGIIVVQVDVAERVRGLGEVQIEVTDPAGRQYNASSGALGAESSARIAQSTADTGHGEFTVEVRGTDDMNQAGINYELTVQLRDEAGVDICESAIPLAMNTVVAGDITESESRLLGASCAGDATTSRELVYTFELEQAQEVSFRANPHDGYTDLALSVQSRCGQEATERGCIDTGVAGEQEVLKTVLEAGTHYLVVQSPEYGSGGPFDLLAETINALCAPGDNYCEDGQTAQICARDGGRFQQVDCSAGCNPSVGECFSPAGDVCGDTPLIEVEADAEDQSDVLVERIQLLEFNHNYEIEQGGCIDQPDTQTGGPDRVYRVDVAAGKGFTARAEFNNEVEGSLYVVEDCLDLNDTCRAGAAGSTGASDQERLNYANRSDTDETVYLVVDTASNHLYDEVELTVKARDIICDPLEYRCHEVPGPEDEPIEVTEQCGAFGVDWFEVQECGAWGCWERQSWCAEADQCWQAIDVTPEAYLGEANFVANWNDFSDQNFGGMCGISSNNTKGPDAYFRADVATGQRIDLSVSRGDSFFYPAIALTRNCADPDQDCLDSARESRWADISYVATADETIYAIVDNDGRRLGDPTNIELKILDPCDSSLVDEQCRDPNTVEFCRDDNFAVPYKCHQGCDSATGRCVPTGEYCQEAIDATQDAATTEGFSYIGLWDDFTENNLEDTMCSVSSLYQEGPEQYYRVDLSAGDTLDVAFDDLSGNRRPTVFIVSSCFDPGNTCLDGDNDSNEATASYTAQEDETVYVIGDFRGWSSTSSNDEFEMKININ